MTAPLTRERMAEIRAVSANSFYDPQRSPIERLFCRELLREVDRLEGEAAYIKARLYNAETRRNKLAAKLETAEANQDAACRAVRGGVIDEYEQRHGGLLVSDVLMQLRRELERGEWPPKETP